MNKVIEKRKVLMNPLKGVNVLNIPSGTKTGNKPDDLVPADETSRTVPAPNNEMEEPN